MLLQHLRVSAKWMGLVAAAGALAVLAACAATRGAVTGARLALPDSAADAGQWMSYGRTWDEQRFSPLQQINDQNVGRLGLAWYADGIGRCRIHRVTRYGRNRKAAHFSIGAGGPDGQPIARKAARTPFSRDLSACWR